MEPVPGCSNSADALPPAEGSTGQGQEDTAAISGSGSLVDVANLAPMTSCLSTS